MAGIPVYGLSGIDEALGAADLGRLCGNYTPSSPSRSFDRYAAKIKNPYYRKAVEKKHRKEIAGLSGVFDVAFTRANEGRASDEDILNIKKVKILLTLNDHNFNAYRFAKIVMPYVVDIDNSGAYYFNNGAIAQAAAQAEEDFFNYVESPIATEIGIDNELARLDGWFKNLAKTLGKGFKAVGKAVANTVTAPVKATIKGAKAGVGVTKAGIQAIRGDKEAAKETLKQAWQNVKDSITEPVITAGNDIKNTFKYTLIDPVVFSAKTSRDIFRSSVKIAGKIFKVLFLKINPVTATMRAQLRAVIAINFMGMATRFNVGLMTEEQAKAQGYDLEAWQSAKKAVNRIIKLFEKMGGNRKKILKSITTGASRKPLFKKDIDAQMKVNVAIDDEEAESALGYDVMAIIAIITAIIKLIMVIWQWIAGVVKQRKAKKELQEAREREAEEQRKQQEILDNMRNKYAHNDVGEFFTDENGNLITWEQYDEMMAEAGNEGDKEKRNKALLIIGGIAVVGVAALMLK